MSSSGRVLAVLAVLPLAAAFGSFDRQEPACPATDELVPSAKARMRAILQAAEPGGDPAGLSYINAEDYTQVRASAVRCARRRVRPLARRAARARAPTSPCPLPTLTPSCGNDPSPEPPYDCAPASQHNVLVPDGFAGFASFLGQLTTPVSVTPVRQIRDRDLVATHNVWDFGGPAIGFDILRFECGLAVEHWDNLQGYTGEIPTNPSGNSMVDGPVAPIPATPERVARNKAIVVDMVTRVLMNGDASAIEEHVGETYTQHNPDIPDGKEGLLAAIGALAEAGVVLRYTKLHAILGEGNFVLTVSEGLYGPAPGTRHGFYDLFRLEGDKVVEHWDTIQPIPPAEEHAHDNGHFGTFPDYTNPEQFAMTS